MTEKLVKEIAVEERKSCKTILRWIKRGLEVRNDKGKIEIKKLYARKSGRNYLVNPDTLRHFRYEIGGI